MDVLRQSPYVFDIATGELTWLYQAEALQKTALSKIAERSSLYKNIHPEDLASRLKVEKQAHENMPYKLLAQTVTKNLENNYILNNVNGKYLINDAFNAFIKDLDITESELLQKALNKKYILLEDLNKTEKKIYNAFNISQEQIDHLVEKCKTEFTAYRINRQTTPLEGRKYSNYAVLINHLAKNCWEFYFRSMADALKIYNTKKGQSQTSKKRFFKFAI